MRKFRNLEKLNKTKLTAESEQLRKLAYALLLAVEREDSYEKDKAAGELRAYMDKTELEER